MSNLRKDRDWPRPRHTRHVWIRGAGKFEPPTQGLVLQWTRHGYKWSALVVYVHKSNDGPDRFVQEWLPAARLWPVKSDPNGASPFDYMP